MKIIKSKPDLDIIKFLSLQTVHIYRQRRFVTKNK